MRTNVGLITGIPQPLLPTWRAPKERRIDIRKNEATKVNKTVKIEHDHGLRGRRACRNREEPSSGEGWRMGKRWEEEEAEEEAEENNGIMAGGFVGGVVVVLGLELALVLVLVLVS